MVCRSSRTLRNPRRACTLTQHSTNGFCTLAVIVLCSQISSRVAPRERGPADVRPHCSDHPGMVCWSHPARAGQRARRDAIGESPNVPLSQCFDIVPRSDGSPSSSPAPSASRCAANPPQSTELNFGLDARMAQSDVLHSSRETRACEADAQRWRLPPQTRIAYVANRKCITSPSATTYSLPSSRSLPASRAPASPPSVT